MLLPSDGGVFIPTFVVYGLRALFIGIYTLIKLAIVVYLRLALSRSSMMSMHFVRPSDGKRMKHLAVALLTNARGALSVAVSRGGENL